MITSNRQSAIVTMMPTLAQCFGIRRAANTALGCPARVYLHQHTPSFFRFVRELCDERRPSGIVNGFGQHPSRQSFDIQILDYYQSKQDDQGARYLVGKIFSLIADVGMRSLQISHGLLSILATAFAAGYLALRSTQFGLRLPIITRVVNLSSIRESSEGGQANINPGCFARYRQCFLLAFHAEDRVPTTSFAFEREGLDLSFNRTMQFQFNLTNALQTEPATIEKSDPISIAGESKGIEAVERFIARVSRFLPVLYPAKERLKGFINTAQNVLCGGEVSQLQIARITYLFQLRGLIIIVERFSRYLVSALSFLQCGIVKGAGFLQLKAQRFNLRLRRVESIFEILSQLSTFLILDIFSDRRFRYVPTRADVITSTPKRRQPRFQEGKFFPQHARSKALELRGNVCRSQCRVSFYKHMNVIRHDLKRVDRCLQFSGFLIQQFFQAFGHRAAKNRLAIFRTPDQVIFESKNRSSILSIARVNHRKDTNNSLDALQQTNAEFQVGDHATQSLRAMRNSHAS